jgi:hypothetical protein
MKLMITLFFLSLAFCATINATPRQKQKKYATMGHRALTGKNVRMFESMVMIDGDTEMPESMSVDSDAEVTDSDIEMPESMWIDGDRKAPRPRRVKMLMVDEDVEMTDLGKMKQPMIDEDVEMTDLGKTKMTKSKRRRIARSMKKKDSDGDVKMIG